MNVLIKIGRLCLILLLLLSVNDFAFGQKKDRSSSKKNPHVIQGDEFFDLFEYVKAAEEYRKAYEEDNSDHYALFRLAESYRHFFDYINAEKYYKIATQTAIHEFPLSRYWYAMLLKDNGNYLEAREQFLTFRKEFTATDLKAELQKEKALQEANGCLKALEELKKPQRNYEFQALPAPVNSPFNDYSPVIKDNDSSIMLTSSRHETVGKGVSGLGESYDDIFYFREGSGNQWTSAGESEGLSNLNTPYAESAGSFTADKTKFYFTQCGEVVKTKDLKTINCAIYVSQIRDGKWQKPVRLNENINPPGEWNAQPSVSPDGKVLFFVSQRAGGVGNHDIWFSSCAGDDNWGTALNMGDQINTPFSEICPRYYGKEKTLFFSSDGREGFGDFDVYFVHEDNMDSIRNVGLPFNSSRKDFYFVLGDKKGYISSDREGGVGNFDIYSYNIESKETLIAYINNDSIREEIKSISVTGTLRHEDTKLPAKNIGVILADDQSHKLKTSTTNEQGDFRFENLPADKNYKVLLQEENAKITKQVKYQVEKVEVKGSEKIVSRVLFENIYFDFDKYDLKPEASRILDKLAAFCKQYPEVQVELNANTDSKGSNEYNALLSQNRGNAAMDYLIRKGVDKAALVVNAMGEGRPVASNESEIGRQLNRRVEFYIVGGAGYTASLTKTTINPKDRALYYVAKQYNMSVEDLESYLKQEKALVSHLPEAEAAGIDYYIVQPKNTLYSISRLYGMTVDELRELNRITDINENVVPGQRLKVRFKKNAPDGYYLVKDGDTVYSIAASHNLTVKDLVRLNKMDGYLLRRNMLLKVK